MLEGQVLTSLEKFRGMPLLSDFPLTWNLDPQDFLRCVSAIIIFLVVSFAAVTSRDGAAIAAFVSPDPQSSPVPQGPLAGATHFLCPCPQTSA